MPLLRTFTPSLHALGRHAPRFTAAKRTTHSLSERATAPTEAGGTLGDANSGVRLSSVR